MPCRMFAAVTVTAALMLGCGPGEPGPDVAALETELDGYLSDRDDGLGLFVHGVEAGGGNRVRVLTQLDESQTAEAEAICNLTTVAGYGTTLSGVDVAAAGGRFIAACEPRV